jgi:hypothetical protein
MYYEGIRVFHFGGVEFSKLLVEAVFVVGVVGDYVGSDDKEGRPASEVGEK